MKKNIYLLRHGSTFFTDEDRFSGVAETRLTDAGKRQIELLAKRLSKFSNKVEAIFTSPAIRCQDSAKIITNEIDVPITIIPNYHEHHYGDWEGLLRNEIVAKFPKEFDDWEKDPYKIAPPNGEDGKSVLKRAKTVLRRLLNQTEYNCLLLVGHKAINRLLLSHIFGVPPRKYRTAISQSPGCLNCISGTSMKDIQVMFLNDTSHYMYEPFLSEKI